jgi:hypothetical protein
VPQPDPSGVAPHVFADETNDPVLAIVLEDAPDADVTKLVIQNYGSSPATYRLSYRLADGTLVETETHFVQGGAKNLALLQGSVGEVNIDGLRHLVEAPPELAPDPPPSTKVSPGRPGKKGRASASIYLPTLAMQFWDMAKLNEFLVDSGFDGVSPRRVSGGLAIQGDYSRVRLLLDLSFVGDTVDALDGSLSAASYLETRVSLGAGYDILRGHRFALFPLVRVMSTQLDLERTLERPGGERPFVIVQHEAGAGLVVAGIGAEMLAWEWWTRGGTTDRRSAGLTLHASAGYQKQIGQPRWRPVSPQDFALTPSQSIDLDRFFIGVGLGVGIWRTWVKQ